MIVTRGTPAMRRKAGIIGVGAFFGHSVGLFIVA